MEVIRKTSHEPYARKRSVSSSVLVVTDSGSDWKSSLANMDSFDRKLQLIEAKKARFVDTILKAKKKMEDCNKFKVGFNIYGNNVVKHDDKQPITANKAEIADFKKYQDLKVSKKKLKAEKEKDCKRSADRRRRDYSRIRREVLAKQRESARMALLEMKKRVRIDDNIDVMREYVRLCGRLADQYGTVFQRRQLGSLDWFLEPEKEDDKTACDDQVHSDKKKKDSSRISREAMEKQRESARMALRQMEKSVDIEDNIDVMAEYARLCGCDADPYGTVFHGFFSVEDLDEGEIFL